MTRGGLDRLLVQALAQADVHIGGDRPWDIDVKDDRLLRRIARHGLVGLGDAYADGWWECPALDQFFERILLADLPRLFRRHPLALADAARQRLGNPQRRPAARRCIERHYNLGNDLFQAMLDRRMTYSCAFWDGASTLDQAQENKLELVCRKLHLRPGQRVLDIGCGWGSFAAYAAERHAARVVGLTLSSDQFLFARDRCRGLPVEIRLADYRDIDEPFDHIVSIGMFEHVGPRNHRDFMRIVRRCLRPGGLFLLHAFFSKRSFPTSDRSEVMWIERRIFPGLAIPSLAQLGAALDDLFNVEDLHNIGVHYDPTLMAWHANVQRAWPRLRPRYGDRFERLWRYYLLSAAGAFRARRYQVWQVVLSAEGLPGGYTPVRTVADLHADAAPSAALQTPPPALAAPGGA